MVGQIGTETTINAGDLAGILMVAVQAALCFAARARVKRSVTLTIVR